MPDSAIPITAGGGPSVDTYTLANGDHRQRVIVGNYGGYTGRSASYRTPGRAGTAGQNLAAIWNGGTGTFKVDVHFVGVDLVSTVVKAITVMPPIIRVCRITAAPTNGTAGFKVTEESINTSNSGVTTYQDASADGTSSASALTTTVTNANSASVAVTQEFAPRFVSAAGYEPADRVEMLTNGPIMLGAGEGLAVFLRYDTATFNPITDSWITTLRWEEYTL